MFKWTQEQEKKGDDLWEALEGEKPLNKWMELQRIGIHVHV